MNNSNNMNTDSIHKLNSKEESNLDNHYAKIEQDRNINYSHIGNFEFEIKKYILKQIQLSEEKK